MKSGKLANTNILSDFGMMFDSRDIMKCKIFFMLYVMPEMLYKTCGSFV